MIFQFGQYKVDVDVEKTRLFYEKAVPVGEYCSCDGCQNFEKAVEVLPESVKAFFSELGVDLKRISECYVYHANKDGNLCYGGVCHICGTLLSSEKKPADGVTDPDTLFSVSKNLYSTL